MLVNLSLQLLHACLILHVNLLYVHANPFHMNELSCGHRVERERHLCLTINTVTQGKEKEGMENKVLKRYKPT